MARFLVRRSAALAIAGVATLLASHSRLAGQEGFRFRSGVELVNVTATVTDRSGRFVSGLTQADFTVYEDDRPVDVTHFSAERVPVSLGIVLDTSGSMAGDKIVNARAAIERFLDQLLNPDDEVFLYGFANDVELIQDWTTNREAAERQPAARASGRRHRDVRRGGRGRTDSSRRTQPQKGGDPHLRRQRHQQPRRYTRTSDRSCARPKCWSTPLASTARESRRSECGHRRSRRRRFRFPFPGRGRPRMPWPLLPQFPPTMAGRSGGTAQRRGLREITDESGGRTEVVRERRDLDRATASIADELSKQVLPRLLERRAIATAAGTPSAWSSATDRCASGRAAGTSRRHEPRAERQAELRAICRLPSSGYQLANLIDNACGIRITPEGHGTGKDCAV